MKKIIFYTIAIALIVSLNSCGVHSALVLNHNQNATQVHLASKNYEVIKKVSGTSDVSYVLIFGGVNKKQLYENAYSQMVEEANLTGSQALINVVTEEHIGGAPPFYYTRTITVSAHVIEFMSNGK